MQKHVLIEHISYLNTILMKNLFTNNSRLQFFILGFLLITSTMLIAQNRDISYLSSGGKLNPLQAIMDIRHYTIALDVDIAKKTIKGSAEVELLLSKSTDTLLLDLVHLYTVNKVKVNNKLVNFEQKNDRIYITASAAFLLGKQTIHIEYAGEPQIAMKG